MQITWKTFPAAVAAGIAGTIVFDILGLVFGMGWDVPGAVAGMLGTGLAVGALMHYAIGIVLTVIFAGRLRSVFRPHVASGGTFCNRTDDSRGLVLHDANDGNGNRRS